MFDLVPLTEAAAKAAALDVSLASDDELLALAPALEDVRRAVEAALGSALGELDVRGTTDARSGHRTATWFAVATNGSRGDARRRVQVGRRLARLDAVRDALAEGAVSFEHARVLADLAVPRNAQVVERLQGDLLALAAVVPFERWRSEVRGIVDLFDPDGGHRPGPESSTLQMATGFGGSIEVSGSFCGLDGAALRAAVDAHADRLRLAYRNDVRAGALDQVPTRAELRAEALAALVRQGVAAGHVGAGPVTDLTLIAHAADPLGRAAHQGTHRGTRTGDHQTGPDSCCAGLADGSGMTAASDLSDATVRTLCCDPVVHAVVLDALGNPLDLGRTTRLVPRALRRGLVARDGGCVFPGCDAPADWCDAHHVVHWADGGSTSVDNLALLCRHHHGATHRNNWTMRSDPHLPQRFTWTRPDGTVIDSQRASDHAQAAQAMRTVAAAGGASRSHGPPGASRE